ncbi:MAG: amino acid synthesis family protein [Ruminococcus sp.]|nr:amino acid synthesis family protein [Ruminococcus sp.]
MRKLDIFVEKICREGGAALEKPLKKCAAVAVIKNPFAGVYTEDLTELMEYGAYLGDYLTRKAVEAMKIPVAEVYSFGKACIVGLDGEHEHAAAIMHPRLGAPMRACLESGSAVIPSAKKIAAAGATLDIPLLYKDGMLVRSHYDSMTVRIPDAPHADEILCAVAFSNGGRPRARIGGLSVEECKGENGLD